MKAVKPFKPVMQKMYRNGNFTTTTNNKFAIRPFIDASGNVIDIHTYSPDLYIRNDVVLDESSPLVKLMKMGLIVESSTKFTKKNYTAYQFFRPLLDTINYDKEGKELSPAKKPRFEKRPDPKIYTENDCLKLGEALDIAMRSGNMEYVINHLQTDVTAPKLCVKIRDRTTLDFGEHEDKNRNLYKNVLSRIDNQAIPNPGQAYAIVRREFINGKAPYHIAFVLYQDNGINITLEAEAYGGEDNPDGAYYPRFAFYDTNPIGYTFHRRWAGDLPGDLDKIKLPNGKFTTRYATLYNNGNTMVLESKPEPQVGPSKPEPQVGPSIPEPPVGNKRKRGGNKSKRKTTLRKNNKTIKSK